MRWKGRNLLAFQGLPNPYHTLEAVMRFVSLTLIALALALQAPALLQAQIKTPPDGYWNDYRSLTRGWLDEFNKFRSERGLPRFVWSEQMYVVLVEYANECKSHNLDIDTIPGPCERPTQKARRVHRWNLYFFDNYTVFLKVTYTPKEAVKSVASVAIIKSITNPRNNAAAVAIVERNAEEVYIIMATSQMKIGPVIEAKESMFLAEEILKSTDANSEDRVKALRDLVLRKHFEHSFLFLEYVRDKDPAVAKQAVAGLNALADPSFVSPLIQAFGQAVPEVHDAIASTLAKITGRRDLGNDQEKWKKWYESSGGSVTRPFEVPDEDVKLSDEEVKRLVDDFKMELKNPDAILRIDAVRKVGRIKHPDIAKAVAKALFDKDPVVRRTASEALHYQADKGTLKDLSKAYPMNKNTPEVLAPIILAFGAIGDYRALPLVTKDLLRPGEAAVTRARVQALGGIRHRDSVQALIDFMVRWGKGARQYRKDLQESLKKLTGQNFGRNVNAWKSWWDRNKKTYR